MHDPDFEDLTVLAPGQAHPVYRRTAAVCPRCGRVGLDLGQGFAHAVRLVNEPDGSRTLEMPPGEACRNVQPVFRSVAC